MPEDGGFADFYQFICTTRAIAGRGLVDQAGFEFMKEGANRVLLVTDEVIRATGLADRVGAGVQDGGLEVAGVFDSVPQDSDARAVIACAEAARAAGADSILALPSRLGLPRRLSEVGVPESAIPSLAEAAMGDGCTLVNPREPSEEDFAGLYARAL